jgi:hypothetical protein
MAPRKDNRLSKKSAIRIARNDSPHAIWLKLSKMPRFIFASIVSIVARRLRPCCQESFVECQDLYGHCPVRFLEVRSRLGDSVETAPEVSWK